MGILTLNYNGKHSWNYFDTVDHAKACRDELLKLYPIDPPKPEPSEYSVSHYDGYEWLVVRSVPTTIDETVATTRSEENAKAIAKALNEAEGL